MFPRLVLAYWRRTHLIWSSAAWSPLSTSADPQKGRSPSSTPPASSAMSQTWQHHLSTINISIIVQCLKSGFWVRKDTLDWGLVRAVGGSGNTSNVHQGTLSTLSLSQPPAASPSRPLAKLDAPRISLRSGVTNLFLCNRLSLIFLTFMFTYVHILYSPHPTGWKGFHFLWNFFTIGKQWKVDNFQHQFHLFGCVFQSDHKLIGSDAVSEM